MINIYDDQGFEKVREAGSVASGALDEVYEISKCRSRKCVCKRPQSEGDIHLDWSKSRVGFLSSAFKKRFGEAD